MHRFFVKFKLMRLFICLFLIIKNVHAHRVTLDLSGTKYTHSGNKESLTIFNNLDVTALVQVLSVKKGLYATVKVNRKKEKKVILSSGKGEKFYFMGVRPPTKKIFLE